MVPSPAFRAVALLAMLPIGLAAQPAPAPPLPIQDNSFLVEEAYNQEPGIVQHIFTGVRPEAGRALELGFSQEWPLFTQRHQLSYTIPFIRTGDPGSDRAGLGDVAIHYRHQMGRIEDARTAFAPRLSLLLPTGSASRGLGAGGAGIQVNLPFSAAVTRTLVMHSNAGATWTDRARDPDGNEATTTDAWVGQSAIWLVRQSLNLMLESVWTSSAAVTGPGRTERATELLVSPGVRGAIDFASGLQVVPGIAVPIAVHGDGRGDWSVFAYLSLEHPFGRRR